MTRVFGCVSSSGLMVRCSVVSFMMVHAIAVNCSAASSSDNARGGCAVERIDAQRRRLFGVGVGDVLADDDRRRILRDLHPLRTVEIGRDGSVAENTNANSPPSSFRSVSLT